MTIMSRGLTFACCWAVLVGLTGCPGIGDDAERDLLGAAQMLRFRPFAGRLSNPFPHVRRLSPTRGARQTDGADVLAVRVAALRILNDESSDDHTRGLAHLLVGDPQAAVASLQRAAIRSNDASTWADLAAAFIASAEASNRTLPLLDALAATDRALRLDGLHPSALFNRALALERLGLVVEASKAWERARFVDTASPWSREARMGRDRTANREQSPWREQDIVDAWRRNSIDEVNGLVRRHPREARTWGEGVFLGQWADATLAHHEQEAAERLSIARAIGVALRDFFGESLLADAVDSIDRADTRTAQTLARAHVVYREGRIAYRDLNLDDAQTRIAEAARLFTAGGSSMAYVATRYEGSVLYAQRRIDESAALLDSIPQPLLQRRGYLALRAEIGWERGLCFFQDGSFSKVLTTLRESQELYSRIGEFQSRAVIDGLLAAVLDVIGDHEQAWSIRRTAFEDLALANDQGRYLAALAEAVERLSADGDWERASAIANVALAAAERTELRAMQAQARSQRSIIRASLKDNAIAFDDLRRARADIESLPDGALSRMLRIKYIFANGVASRNVDERRAIAAFTKVLQFIERSGAEVDAPRAHLERARVRRRIGDLAGAAADLDAALAKFETRRVSLDDSEQRALTLVSAEEIFDDAISVAIQQNDPVRAFSLSERARARVLLDLFERRSDRAALPMTPEAIRSALAEDAAIVSWARNGDRIVTFLVRPNAIIARESSVTMAEVAALASVCTQSMRNPNKSSPACSRVYEALLGNVEEELAGIRVVAFIPHPLLGDVLYGALTDRAGAEVSDRFFVIEAPSATMAVACSLRAQALPPRSGRTLVIGATELAREARPDLRPLEWVTREANDVAAHYRQAQSLIGPAAVPDRVLVGAATAEVLHFAGHSVASARRPAESQLLLARDEHGNDGLDALTISRTRLSATHLAYLSSCRSSAASPRVDGVDNLALAFIVAGVPSVIAMKWDVEDRAAYLAAQSIHQGFARGEDPAIAVATARRRFESNPSLSDSEWPPLVVVGGSRELIRKKGR